MLFPVALLLQLFGMAAAFSAPASLALAPQIRLMNRHAFFMAEDSISEGEEVDPPEQPEPPPDGFEYDSFGRLIVKGKARTVKEAKPASPLMQKVVGLMGLALLLLAAGFTMNFAFSPASPFMQSN